MKHPNIRSHRAAGAFTLVEMLLVIAILAILFAIVGPKLAGQSEKGRIAAAKTQISNLSAALGMYEIDNGSYPRSLDGLIAAPSDATNWHGPYMEKGIPLDPWNNPYNYAYPGKNNPDGFDLSSGGQDGRSDSAINNWTTGR